MGQLDEATFTALMARPCPACGNARLELRSMLDQWIPVMVADVAGDPRWIHDGEKFVDGTYRITCASCRHDVFASDDCPRCHAPEALAAALAAPARVKVPKACPTCRAKELVVIAMVPSMTMATAGVGGKHTPRELAELGDDGCHVVSVTCDDCGEIASCGTACPVCGAAGPLRARP